MNVLLPSRMTVDEFLAWSARQDSGRYELEQARVIMQQSQNIAHLRTKQRVVRAHEDAIAHTRLDLYALPDGATVRISADTCYEPDALVAPLPIPDGTSLEVPNPVIVVEVLSPGSVRRDLVTKAAGYALVRSILHYLVVDPADRVVLHYARKGDMLAPPAAPSEGTLRLDPPGLEIPVEDMLTPAPPA